METGGSMHMEMAQGNPDQIAEHGLPSLQDAVFNHDRTMHFAGLSHDHSPIQYRPPHVFPYPGGYIVGTYEAYPDSATVDSSNVMLNGPQFNYIQQPLFHRNYMSFGEGIPIAYHSQGSGELIANTFILSCLYYPEQFDGNFSPPGAIEDAQYQSSMHNRAICNAIDRDFDPKFQAHYCSPHYAYFSSPEHQVLCSSMSYGQNFDSGSLIPGHYMGGWPWMNINGAPTHGTCHWNSLSPFNFIPTPQGYLQHHFPMSSDSFKNAVIYENARNVNGAPHRCFQDSVAASRPFSSCSVGLSYKTNAKLCGMGMENTTVTRIPNEQNYSQSRHGLMNTVRISSTESSRISPAVRATNGRMGNIQSGKPGQAQQGRLTWVRKVATPPAKESGNQTLTPRQVCQRKTKTQPSSSPSKPSSKHTPPSYHIKWNGFDEPFQPVGVNCHLCNRDLALESTNYDSQTDHESDCSILPSVAILLCGHVFHSDCLQCITPEDQSRYPPCEICSNANS